jgi:hypothetical protein
MRDARKAAITFVTVAIARRIVRRTMKRTMQTVVDRALSAAPPPKTKRSRKPMLGAAAMIAAGTAVGVVAMKKRGGPDVMPVETDAGMPAVPVE